MSELDCGNGSQASQLFLLALGSLNPEMPGIFSFLLLAVGLCCLTTHVTTLLVMAFFTMPALTQRSAVALL